MVRSSSRSPPLPPVEALTRKVTGSSSMVPTARSSQAWSGTLTVNVAVSGARAAIDSAVDLLQTLPGHAGRDRGEILLAEDETHRFDVEGRAGLIGRLDDQVRSARPIEMHRRRQRHRLDVGAGRDIGVFIQKPSPPFTSSSIVELFFAGVGDRELRSPPTRASGTRWRGRCPGCRGRSSAGRESAETRSMHDRRACRP